MIYIGVVGSRKRNKQSDYQLVKQHILQYKRAFPAITIVSGGADGIDTIVRRVANELNISIIEFLPNRDEYKIKGNGIYNERNRLIAKKSDYLNAYPLNMSGGTMNTVAHFKQLGKSKRLRIYDST